MKFVIQVIVTIILALLFELFMPWWSIAIAAFFVAAIVNSKLNFLAGFLGIALLWLGMAFLIESSAAAPLADRVTAIFMGISKTLLFVITGFIGGLIGGLAAMAGGALRKQKKPARYY